MTVGGTCDRIENFLEVARPPGGPELQKVGESLRTRGRLSF